MKQFFKITLATMLGVFLFCLINFIIMIAVLGGIMSIQNASVPTQKNSVFRLELEGVIVERMEENSLETLLASMNESTNYIGLDEVLTAIDAASKDDNVSGIYLKLGMLQAAPASITEIRDALQRFKKDGKFVVAYGDNFSNGTYQLATAADKVYMNPQGMPMLTGIKLNTIFYKGLLDKLGVEMQIFKVGTFKSAVEPFCNTALSDANRLQLNVLSQSIWNEIIIDAAQARHIDTATINRFANNGLFFAAADSAVAYGLVDSLLYENDMKRVLQRLTNDDNFHTIKLRQMKRLAKSSSASDRVAVLYANGEIDGMTGNSGIDSKKIVEQLLKLADNDDVKAVVMRVNSPGGSAYGSEQIWHAAEVLRAKKPFIVSMSDYAASGGYYISCSADTIVAQPNTLTGSIGIFGMFPNLQGATQKLGLTFDGVKTNRFSDLGDITRPMNDAERQLMQQYIERGYALFVQRCAEGRSLSVDSIRTIAEGRVWSGKDAQQLGLVDVLGGLDTAITIAAEKAQLTDYSLVTYPPQKDITTQLIEKLYDNQTRILQRTLGEKFTLFQQVCNLKDKQGLFALMPYYIAW